jgi:HSP20 family protein
MSKHEVIHFNRNLPFWPNSFGRLVGVRHDVERALEDLFDDFKISDLKEHLGKNADVRVLVDFKEDAKSYNLIAEVPGIDAKDLEVEFKDGFLTLKGEKKTEKKEEKEGYFHQECSYGSVSRTISIPDDADVDSAVAEMKHGVLTLKIPKKEAVAPNVKKIEIKTAK